MTDPTIQAVINQTVALIRYYGFETGGLTAVELVTNWLEVYQPIWVRFATIEALYQGRYKAVSVEQILAFWVRRGHPTYHFSHEFESLVCRKIPLFPTRRAEWEKLRQVLAEAASSTPSDLADEAPASRELLEDFLQAGDFNDLTFPAEGDRNAIDSERLEPKAHHRPIHKFTPPQDGSGFYDKLKKVTDSRQKRRF